MALPHERTSASPKRLQAFDEVCEPLRAGKQALEGVANSGGVGECKKHLENSVFLFSFVAKLVESFGFVLFEK